MHTYMHRCIHVHAHTHRYIYMGVHVCALHVCVSANQGPLCRPLCDLKTVLIHSKVPNPSLSDGEELHQEAPAPLSHLIVIREVHNLLMNLISLNASNLVRLVGELGDLLPSQGLIHKAAVPHGP